MQVNELTNTQALIDRYYTEERDKKALALTLATLNLQLNANDLAMLSTIAKRFGKSRDDLAKDIVGNALIDMMSQLEPGERKLIARDADEMANSMAKEIADENGLKDIDHKPNAWTTHERNIAKAEKKRAKELEDQKKQQAALQSQANAQVEAEDSTQTDAEVEAAPASDAAIASEAPTLNSEETEAISSDDASNDNIEEASNSEQDDTEEQNQSVFA